MKMSGLSSIFTTMPTALNGLILRLLRFGLGHLQKLPRDDPWLHYDTLATQYGLPREWVVCPHCGQQGWRFPPHQFEPCPLVVKMADTAELKLDADRMAAIRGGIHIEKLTEYLEQFQPEEDEE